MHRAAPQLRIILPQISVVRRLKCLFRALHAEYTRKWNNESLPCVSLLALQRGLLYPRRLAEMPLEWQQQGSFVSKAPGPWLCLNPSHELLSQGSGGFWGTAHHQGVGTRRLCAWSLAMWSAKGCPQPASQLCMKSHSQTRTAGSGTQQASTYLPMALSPPSPHPPLGKMRREVGGKRGRR